MEKYGWAWLEHTDLVAKIHRTPLTQPSQTSLRILDDAVAKKPEASSILRKRYISKLDDGWPESVEEHVTLL